MKDTVNAFTPHAPFRDYEPAGDGPLSDLTFAVKDLFDVEGMITGAGNPTWARGQVPAQHDAPAVACLRRAGARFAGKTVMDELAWSLGGENIHYGAPGNTVAPGRVTGGSSSGSAAAVAAGLVDTALGTDTGGSIRLPASFTGTWGIRTSHGAIARDGVVPLAPSFDTIGWLARDAETLHRVGVVFFPDVTAFPEIARVRIAADLFDRLPRDLREPLIAQARRLAEDLGLSFETVQLAPDGIADWRETFRVCQADEAWTCHGRWVEESGAHLGPDIIERFRMASRLAPSRIEAANRDRAAITRRMQELVDRGTLLVTPGAAGPPPLLAQSPARLAAERSAALDLLCPASLAGMPQLAMPCLSTRAGPLGLGLAAARGDDMILLSVARRVARHPHAFGSNQCQIATR
ncbi:MAG: amidase [Pseudomonadota bacterium]